MRYLLKVIFCLLPIWVGAQESKITFAFAEQPPYVEFDDDGYPSGEYVSLAMALAESLDMTYEFWSCPFERCLQLIKSAKADIIIGVEMREELLHYMSFIRLPAYFDNSLSAFYIEARQTPPVNLQEYLQIRPKNLPGSALYFHHDGQNIDFHQSIRAQSLSQYFMLLASGRIDVIVTAKNVGQHILKQHKSMKPLTSWPIAHSKLNKSLMIGIGQHWAINERVNWIRQYVREMTPASDLLFAQESVSELVALPTNN